MDTPREITKLERIKKEAGIAIQSITMNQIASLIALGYPMDVLENWSQGKAEFVLNHFRGVKAAMTRKERIRRRNRRKSGKC